MTERPTLYLECLAMSNILAHVRTLIEYRWVDWGLTHPAFDEARGNLGLIAAELVTNAVRETPEQTIRVHSAFEPEIRIILFGVWDSSPRRPKPSIPDLTLETLDLSEENFDCNGGWGLGIVESLAVASGIDETRDPSGKWVWAKVKI